MTSKIQLAEQQNYRNSTQRRIGLTGGIASGKSSICKFLSKAKGLPVLDADIYAREVLAPGTSSTKAVFERYGNCVVNLNPNSPITLDRKAIAKIVFKSQQERLWLEKLVHPLIKQRLASEIASLHQSPIVVLMIPLLFEAKLTSFCNEIWLIDCEPEQQCKRLMSRDGLTKKEATARISAQWPMKGKRMLSDVVIDNRGKPKEWRNQVNSLLEQNSA